MSVISDAHQHFCRNQCYEFEHHPRCVRHRFGQAQDKIDQLKAENERLKNDVEAYKQCGVETREYHSAAMIELANQMGADVSDEPRLKWVSLELHSLVTERDTLRKSLDEARGLLEEAADTLNHCRYSEKPMAKKLYAWLESTKP